jgi:hypothetical protein
MLWLLDPTNLIPSEPKILFISFFLYFIIVRNSIRTVEKDNYGIIGNKQISFGSSKKRSFDI